jgi:hypothetical protein
MSDRAIETDDTAADSQPSKKKYTAPVLLHWGTFQELTQYNGRGNQTDGRSGGRNYRGTN